MDYICVACQPFKKCLKDRYVMERRSEFPNQFRWTDYASCKNAPSFIFFPEEVFDEDFEMPIAFKDVTYKSYCDSCPVKRLCEQHAVLHDEKGIWGGLTDRERKVKYSKELRWEMRNDMEECGKYVPLYGHA